MLERQLLHRFADTRLFQSITRHARINWWVFDWPQRETCFSEQAPCTCAKQGLGYFRITMLVSIIDAACLFHNENRHFLFCTSASFHSVAPTGALKPQKTVLIPNLLAFLQALLNKSPKGGVRLAGSLGAIAIQRTTVLVFLYPSSCQCILHSAFVTFYLATDLGCAATGLGFCVGNLVFRVLDMRRISKRSTKVSK